MYVELKNINKNFGDYKASDNVNFGVEKGKLIGLLGPSGSGKTTILRMIAGLETPDSGDIIIDGVRVNDLAASKRGIGFVFQNYALFRYMTVYDNIAFGLRVQKADKKKIDERVRELIKLIGLEGLEKRYPSQLSGGQRQRVAFARALAPNPQLLLLDEPFAAIDAKVRKELRSWLREMIEKLGVTSIFVTHDQDEAIRVELNRREHLLKFITIRKQHLRHRFSEKQHSLMIIQSFIILSILKMSKKQSYDLNLLK